MLKDAFTTRRGDEAEDRFAQNAYVSLFRANERRQAQGAARCECISFPPFLYPDVSASPPKRKPLPGGESKTAGAKGTASILAR